MTMSDGIRRVAQSRAYREGQAAPPWVRSVTGVDSADSVGAVTDVYDMEEDKVGARWQPYTALILTNYDFSGSLYVQLGRTTVLDDGEYQVPPQAQLSLTSQRIRQLAIRRQDTVSYRITLRRDASIQELG